jgi:hypothetical protein
MRVYVAKTCYHQISRNQSAQPGKKEFSLILQADCRSFGHAIDNSLTAKTGRASRSTTVAVQLHRNASLAKMLPPRVN